LRDTGRRTAAIGRVARAHAAGRSTARRDAPAAELQSALDCVRDPAATAGSGCSRPRSSAGSRCGALVHHSSRRSASCGMRAGCADCRRGLQPQLDACLSSWAPSRLALAGAGGEAGGTRSQCRDCTSALWPGRNVPADQRGHGPRCPPTAAQPVQRSVLVQPVQQPFGQTAPSGYDVQRSERRCASDSRTAPRSPAGPTSRRARRGANIADGSVAAGLRRPLRSSRARRHAAAAPSARALFGRAGGAELLLPERGELGSETRGIGIARANSCSEGLSLRRMRRGSPDQTNQCGLAGSSASLISVWRIQTSVAAQRRRVLVSSGR